MDALEKARQEIESLRSELANAQVNQSGNQDNIPIIEKPELATFTADEKWAAIMEWRNDPEVQKKWWGRVVEEDPSAAVETSLGEQLAIQQQARKSMDEGARLSFTELFDKIQLDDSKRTEFIKHWVDAEVAALEVTRQWNTPGLNDEELANSYARIAAIKQQLNDQALDVFGSYLPEYHEYREAIPERDAFNRYASVWREPLEANTRSAIISIMVEERNAAGIPNRFTGQTEEKLQWEKDVLMREESRDAAVIKRVVGMLTQNQLKGLKDSLAADRTERESLIQALESLEQTEDSSG